MLNQPLTTTSFLFWVQVGLVLASSDQNSESNLNSNTWLVINRQPNKNLSLTCQDSHLYPFNATNLAKRIVWQVPVGSVSLYLEADQSQFGWEVLPSGIRLQIKPSLFPKTIGFGGIYKCAILAPLQTNTTHYAWHYLSWAVDYYADENLLIGSTSIEKFGRNLITLLIVWASFISIVVLLKLLHVYSYESRNKEFMLQESDMNRTSWINQIKLVNG